MFSSHSNQEFSPDSSFLTQSDLQKRSFGRPIFEFLKNTFRPGVSRLKSGLNDVKMYREGLPPGHAHIGPGDERMKATGTGGYFNPTYRAVVIGPAGRRNIKRRKQVLRHELQHAYQAKNPHDNSFQGWLKRLDQKSQQHSDIYYNSWNDVLATFFKEVNARASEAKTIPGQLFNALRFTANPLQALNYGVQRALRPHDDSIVKEAIPGVRKYLLLHGGLSAGINSAGLGTAAIAANQFGIPGFRSSVPEAKQTESKLEQEGKAFPGMTKEYFDQLVKKYFPKEASSSQSLFKQFKQANNYSHWAIDNPDDMMMFGRTFHRGDADSPRGQMINSIKSQQTSPSNYRSQVGESLLRSRYPNDLNRLVDADTFWRGDSSRQPGAFGRPGGQAHVPSQAEIPQSLPDFYNGLGYNALANHELEHAVRQTSSMPRSNKEIEYGPTIGDLVFRAEQFRREEGKPLDHTVHFPGGSSHNIQWMQQQAQNHGYWKGRSMTDLLFNTPEGRAWLKTKMPGSVGVKKNAPELMYDPTMNYASQQNAALLPEFLDDSNTTMNDSNKFNLDDQSTTNYAANLQFSPSVQPSSQRQFDTSQAMNNLGISNASVYEPSLGTNTNQKEPNTFVGDKNYTQTPLPWSPHKRMEDPLDNRYRDVRPYAYGTDERLMEKAREDTEIITHPVARARYFTDKYNALTAKRDSYLNDQSAHVKDLVQTELIDSRKKPYTIPEAKINDAPAVRNSTVGADPRNVVNPLLTSKGVNNFSTTSPTRTANFNAGVPTQSTTVPTATRPPLDFPVSSSPKFSPTLVPKTPPTARIPNISTIISPTALPKFSPSSPTATPTAPPARPITTAGPATTTARSFRPPQRTTSFTPNTAAQTRQNAIINTGRNPTTYNGIQVSNQAAARNKSLSQVERQGLNNSGFEVAPEGVIRRTNTRRSTGGGTFGVASPQVPGQTSEQAMRATTGIPSSSVINPQNVLAGRKRYGLSADGTSKLPAGRRGLIMARKDLTEDQRQMYLDRLDAYEASKGRNRYMQKRSADYSQQNEGFFPSVADLIAPENNLVVGGAGALGAAGMSHKGLKDVQEVNKQVANWYNRSGFDSKNADSLANSIKRLQKYVQGGQGLARTKVLGVPVSLISQAGLLGNTSLEDIINLSPAGRRFHRLRLQIVESPGNGFIKRKLSPKSEQGWNRLRNAANNPNYRLVDLWNHYGKFRDKSKSQEELVDYLISKKLNTNKLSPVARQIISQHKNIATRLLRLKQQAPEDYNKYKSGIKDAAKLVYGIGGDGSGGYVDNYARSLFPLTNDLSRNLRRVRGGGAIGGLLALAAGSGMHAMKAFNPPAPPPPPTFMDKLRSLFSFPEKKSQDKLASEVDDNTILQSVLNSLIGTTSATAAGLGGYSIASGTSMRNKPLSLGISYGNMPDVGDGHKSPGNAIKEALQRVSKQDGVPAFKLTDVSLGPNAEVNIPALSRTYDGFFDTGMGSTMPKSWFINHWDPNKRILDNPDDIKKIPQPNVRLGGFVGYKTDVGSGGTPYHAYNDSINNNLRRLAAMVGVRDQFLDWSNKVVPTPSNQMASFDKHTLSERGNPAIKKTTLDALEQINTRPKEDMYRELLADPSVSDKNKQLLQDALAQNKKILAITGSGRGDQVALKTRDILRELRRRGLSDKVQIVSMLARSGDYTPYAKIIADRPDVASFGFVSPKIYSGLPAMADLHYGSSGTSALFEALAGKSPLALPDSASAWRDREINKLLKNVSKDPNKPVYELSRLAKRLGVTEAMLPNLRKLRHVDLDSWNKGNKAHAWSLPGVGKAQTAADVVDMLLNSDNLKQEAASRADDIMQQNRQGTENLEKFLKGYLHDRMNYVNRVGRLKQVGGGTALGAGVGGLSYLLGGGLRTAAKEREVKNQIAKLVGDMKDYIRN